MVSELLEILDAERDQAAPTEASQATDD